MTTTFLWVDPADTAADLKAKIHKITKVPAGDIKLFIDKTGDVVLDETKSLADQKARRAPMPPFSTVAVSSDAFCLVCAAAG